MSKHLLQKEKTEKKIKNKADYIEDEMPQENIEPKVKLKRKRNVTSGKLFSLILPALLLIVIQFVPLEGWYLKAGYAVIFLIAALEFIWDLLDSIQDKDYFCISNVALLVSIASFVVELNIEAILILLVVKVCNIIWKKAEDISWDKLKKVSSFDFEAVKLESAEGLLSIAPDYVNVGDIIHIDAGSFIPVDGIIVEGISTIDTSAISGQSAAWAVNEGHRVYSGCRNITSPIRVKVKKPFSQSTVQNLIKLAKSSVEYYSRQEKLALKIRRFYAPLMFALALVLFVVLSVLNGQWLKNAQSSLVLLSTVCTCPALLSIGYGYIKSIGMAVEMGVFAKGSDCIESMAKSETVVFDKTGIITEGKYIITDVFPNKVTEHELLTMAATAERFSRHPVAAALRDAAGQIDIDYRSLQIEEVPGRGISAFVGEKQVFVGNTALLEEHGIKCAVPVRPGAAIHVAVDYKYWGHILVTDRIRRGAFDSLENLRAQGVKKMVLLTGDVLSVAKPLASKLNFDMLRAELKPSEKVSAIDYLMSNRGDSTALAFVGDGNSDEQIMSRVDVGVALGALGSDTALSSADVMIMDRDIKKIPAAFRISRLTYHVNLINLLAWLAVNALIVLFGMLGLLPVLWAIIAEFLLNCGILINMLRIK